MLEALLRTKDIAGKAALEESEKDTAKAFSTPAIVADPRRQFQLLFGNEIADSSGPSILIILASTLCFSVVCF